MDSVEMTALSGVHRCETSGAVNLGQPWHSKPSSSSDRRHNSLLPAATHFNDLWGTLSEATNAEKSILFQGRFDRRNVFFLVSQKTPLVVENLLCKMEWKYINYFVGFFFFFLHFSSVCSICCAPADHPCCTVVRVCARGTTWDESDGRQPLLKEVELQKSDLIFT